jgi:acyl-coenzyme A thioesterase PaaI-like protein
MLTTLLDHALSAIAWEANERKPCVTVQFDVQFVAPAHPGDFIEARGRVVRQSSSLVFLQGGPTVRSAEIATASAILKIR